MASGFYDAERRGARGFLISLRHLSTTPSNSSAVTAFMPSTTGTIGKRFPSQCLKVVSGMPAASALDEHLRLGEYQADTF